MSFVCCCFFSFTRRFVSAHFHQCLRRKFAFVCFYQMRILKIHVKLQLITLIKLHYYKNRILVNIKLVRFFLLFFCLYIENIDRMNAWWFVKEEIGNEFFFINYYVQLGGYIVIVSIASPSIFGQHSFCHCFCIQMHFILSTLKKKIRKKWEKKRKKHLMQFVILKERKTTCETVCVCV